MNRVNNATVHIADAKATPSSARIPQTSRHIDSRGFTLTELAVVLVIVGTVFLTVLKVEGMLKSAKIRQVINQYQQLRSAILVYKDKYGYLPGDDPYATLHVGATGAIGTLAAHNGNGNQQILLNAGYPEYSFAFEHLSKAGLLAGTFTGAIGLYSYPDPPLKHAFNDQVVIIFETLGTKSGNCVRFDNLPPDVAQAIDTMLDDGNAYSGSIRGFTLQDRNGRATHDYTEVLNSHYVLGVMIFFD